MLNFLRYMLSKVGGPRLPNPNVYAPHTNIIGGTSEAMKPQCPEHMTQALGRWAGDSAELYERVDIGDSLHWFSQNTNTDWHSAEISRLVIQQHLPDPTEDGASSAIEADVSQGLTTGFI